MGRWGFPTALRVDQEGKQRLLERDFRVNIWDFGGQEIYHATHQFFLTRRSVYLLVTDDRKEDTDFNWWLQVEEMLSDGSPLIIVQNEKQDRRRDIGHWEREKSELDAAMKEVGSENLDGIRETIDLYTWIRATAAEIMEILGDMNALTPGGHQGSGFEELLAAIEGKLAD